MRNFSRLNLLFVILFSSCVYTFSGGFPSKYRNVYIEPLKNNTQRQDITLDIQNYLMDEVRKDGRLNIVSSKQAMLKVVPYLLNFEKSATEFTETGEITVYTITIKAKILTYPMDDSIYFLNDTIFYGRGVYSASGEDEGIGIKRATKDMIDNFLDKLFETKSGF